MAVINCARGKKQPVFLATSGGFPVGTQKGALWKPASHRSQGGKLGFIGNNLPSDLSHPLELVPLVMLWGWGSLLQCGEDNGGSCGPLSPWGLEGSQSSTTRSARPDSAPSLPLARLPAACGTGTGTRTDMAARSQPQKATYDVIVIGAGIQGSFAAYHLAQRHRDTLLLEQVPAAPCPVSLVPLCPQLCCVPCPTVSPAPTCQGGHLQTWLPSAMARTRAAASTPVSPLPGPPRHQCQDSHVPVARTPMSPVPGPPHPQGQDPHVLPFSSTVPGRPGCVPRSPLWHSTSAHGASGVVGWW